MGRPVNALKIIENTRTKINQEYDMSIDNVIKIKNSSKDTFNLICNAFVFGYAQGAKAQKRGCAYHE